MYERDLSGVRLFAARDEGDTKGDKKRTARVQALVALAEEASGGEKTASFTPEVKAALDAIASAAGVVTRMQEQGTKLRTAKTGTQQAIEAQLALDGLRMTVDAMLTPLEATASAMLALLERAQEMEAAANQLATQAAAAQAAWEKEKARLISISTAVQNAANVQ